MLPSETMIWQPEFTDKTLSRKPGAVHTLPGCAFSFETNEVLVTSLKSITKISNIKNNAIFITF
ncbi:hypothetical protein [Escherichia coli]|nr:hypothetical protein [Escherichia coli]